MVSFAEPKTRPCICKDLSGKPDVARRSALLLPSPCRGRYNTSVFCVVAGAMFDYGLSFVRPRLLAAERRAQRQRMDQ